MELRIESMTCGGCAKQVTRAVHSVDPHADVTVDPVARTIKVKTTVTVGAIQDVLEEAGYPATLI